MSLDLPRNDVAFPDRYWALPALLILLAQVGLYIWMAPRGFDFTDEAYYFHNYLHWREFTGNASFFGAYFEWPFRALGQSVGAIRVLTLVLILASSAVLMRELLRFSMREQPAALQDAAGWPYLVAPMAAAMMYFGSMLTTLRAPSYNLLSLCTMALSSACLLRAIRTENRGQASRGAPFLYGVMLGACFLSKATTAVALLLVHAVFFIAANQVWQVRRLLALAGLVTAGVVLNLLALTVAFPQWPQSLREGVALTLLRGGGYTVAELIERMRWDLQLPLESISGWIAGAAILFFVVRSRLRPGSVWAISLITLLLTTMVGVVLTVERAKPFWLFAMTGATVGLWFLERLGRTPGPMRRGEWADAGGALLLLSQPLIFSIGTNNPTLLHSLMAAMLAYCGVFLRLYVLRRKRMLNAVALAASVCVLCVPALAAQFLAMTQAKSTYRQLTGLEHQNRPVSLANNTTTLLVDPVTEQSLREILALAHSAGFQPEQDVLDLTGDSPGMIYALGANPLGAPWLLGGYKGSEAATIRIIDQTGPTALRHAWLLTSTDNPLRMTGWESVLEQRIGRDTHVLVGTIKFAKRYGRSAELEPFTNVQLWKPVAASRKTD